MSGRYSRYVLPHYNGFDDRARRAVTPIQRAAIQSGVLSLPTACCICGFGDPARPEGRGYLFLHTEDYRQPLTIYPLCKKHHADLHARFRDPSRWLRVLQDYGRPGEWFMLLTFDPASQWRSFDETYPDGLPPPPDPRQPLLI